MQEHIQTLINVDLDKCTFLSAIFLFLLSIYILWEVSTPIFVSNTDQVDTLSLATNYVTNNELNSQDIEESLIFSNHLECHELRAYKKNKTYYDSLQHQHDFLLIYERIL